MTRLRNGCAAGALLALLACTDKGIVGEAFGCDAACSADQVCDLQSNRCMPIAGSGAESCPDGNCLTCPDGGTDCELPDECDDCAPADTACIALFCVSCDSNADCPAEEPICIQGRCMEFDP